MPKNAPFINHGIQSAFSLLTRITAGNLLRKIIFALLIGFLSFQATAQEEPKIYAGIDYFRNKSFSDNSYFNLNLGSQIFRWHILAPEIGYEYHLGRLRERNERDLRDPNAVAPSQLRTRFSSHTFSLAPKLIFGNEEAALVFIPQYNTGKITAKGEFLEVSGRRYELAEQQEITNSIDFWSFAVGVEGDLFNSHLIHFSILVKYHLLNSEESLQQLDLESTDLRSTGGSEDGIGLSFRIYFDFLQLLNNET